MKRDLTTAELQQARVLATIARDVYNPDPAESETWVKLTDEQVNRLGITSAFLQETLSSQIARDNGLRAGLYRTTDNELVLAFAGTNLTSARDWLTNVRQAAGFKTDEYSKAAVLARQFKMVPGVKLITGHSKGGAIASLASAVTETSAITFNTAGVHPNTLEREGYDYTAFKENIANNLIKNIVVEGEAVQIVNGLPLMPNPVGEMFTITGETIGNLTAIERHSINNVIEAIDDTLYARDLGAVRTTLDLKTPLGVEQAKRRPTVFLIAGPNGAGKSTLYNSIIKPKINAPFINADVIQKYELRDPSMTASYTARDMAIERRAQFLKEGKSFVFETVFSHPSKLAELADYKAAGFNVVLYHIGLNSPDLSVERVRQRVKKGGHDVPEQKIRERFERNQPLIRDAALISDRAFIYDNSVQGRALRLGVELEKGNVVSIGENLPKWQRGLYETQLLPFSQTRQNPAAASYDVVRRMAEETIGGPVRVDIPKIGIRYIGPLIGESALHYLQKTPQQFVAHFKSVFDGPQKLGKPIEIVYKSQRKAVVSASVTPPEPPRRQAKTQNAAVKEDWFIAPRALDSYNQSPKQDAEARALESAEYRQGMKALDDLAPRVFTEPKVSLEKLSDFVKTTDLTDTALSDYVLANIEKFGPLRGQAGLAVQAAEKSARAEAVKYSRTIAIKTRELHSGLDYQRAQELDAVKHERMLDESGIKALHPQDMKLINVYGLSGEARTAALQSQDFNGASESRIKTFDRQIEARFGHVGAYLANGKTVNDPVKQATRDLLEQNKTLLINIRTAAANMGQARTAAQTKGLGI